MANPAELARFMAAVGEQESHRNYDWNDTSSAGAHGYYQFMPSTWVAACRLAGVDPNDHSPPAQDAAARAMMSQLYDRYGDWEKVAEAWNGGPGAVGSPQVRAYGQHVMSLYSSANLTSNPSSVSTMGNAGTDTGLPVTDADARTYIRAHYGGVAWAMDDPELGPILMNAARQGLDSTNVDGLVKGTNWWKTHSASSRQWQELQGSDPAEANKQLQARYQYIARRAQQLGIPLTLQQIYFAGNIAMAGGMTDEEVDRGIAGNADWNPQTQPNGPAGDIGAKYAAYKAQAADMLLPIDDQTVYGWAKKAATGESDDQAFSAYLRAQTLGRFSSNPDLTNAINAGVTLKDYFAPYRNALGQLLEVSPDQIDMLNDPKYSKIADYVDPKTGIRRSMTIGEAQDYVRSTSDWDQTHNAMATYSGLALQLGQMFGRTGATQ